MNLQKVNPSRGVFVYCCHPDHHVNDMALHGSRWVNDFKAYADLDGEPFKAFYCGPCAAKLQGRSYSVEPKTTV